MVSRAPGLPNMGIKGRGYAMVSLLSISNLLTITTSTYVAKGVNA